MDVGQVDEVEKRAPARGGVRALGELRAKLVRFARALRETVISAGGPATEARPLDDGPVEGRARRDAARLAPCEPNPRSHGRRGGKRAAGTQERASRDGAHDISFSR